MAKRSQAKSHRERFLYTNLTEDEYKKISKYCRQRDISISQFFADLLIGDASKSRSKGRRKMTLEIELTPKEHEKLEQLTRLHAKESERLHAPIKTKHVRYYFSDEELELVTKHMRELRKSPSNYPAILALRSISKTAKKPGK